MRTISELRKDIVTGDWVVVAVGRAKRPDQFAKRRDREQPQPKQGCPFECLLPTTLLAYDRAGKQFRLTAKDRRYLDTHWQVQVIPNKYPAFAPGSSSAEHTIGPYQWRDGVGFHEVVISRDHNRTLAKMTSQEASIVLRAYRDRYLLLKDDDVVEYISIFHNHGRDAGASISHPHSQIIAIPVIPPDIGRSLRGSAEYFRKNKECVHCTMLDFEKKERKRIIYQNRDFLVLCPFISRQAFEIRIFPKRHAPRFEDSSDREIASAAQALRTALAKLAKGLRDPAYNFFIHTAPASSGESANHYHWHIEILPKTQVWAGFEIGTGIEISTISPESAAAFLRRIKVS